MTKTATARDYSLIGRDSALAVESGLAAAEWYHTEIPRKTMKELMQRSDGPALRDTAIWFALLIGLSTGGIVLWGTWWAVPFFLAYGVVYGGSADSRWHECGHGTAFKTRWMNDVIYQIACFMIMREPTIWRWSHTRHHTDTIIVGRDPEIVAMRPPDLLAIGLNLFSIKHVVETIGKLVIHAGGRLTAEEETFVPDMERPRVYRTARIWLLIHLVPIALAIALQSWIPVLLVGPLPTMYGAWYMVFMGFTQHAGLAENVLDHRLNSRTVYTNIVNRYLYWNMNYHVEHHMFPMVPYHRLPQLHAIMKSDTPRPYASMLEAYGEIVPAVWRQLRDPEYHVKRELPPSAKPYRPDLHGETISAPAE